MRRIFFLLSLGVFIFSSVYADTITLKSGQEVEGTIISRDSKQVTVDVMGVNMPYFLDDVTKINGEPLAAPVQAQNSDAAQTGTAPESLPAAESPKAQGMSAAGVDNSVSSVSGSLPAATEITSVSQTAQSAVSEQNAGQAAGPVLGSEQVNNVASAAAPEQGVEQPVVPAIKVEKADSNARANESVPSVEQLAAPALGAQSSSEPQTSEPAQDTGLSANSGQADGSAEIVEQAGGSAPREDTAEATPPSDIGKNKMRTSGSSQGADLFSDEPKGNVSDPPDSNYASGQAHGRKDKLNDIFKNNPAAKTTALAAMGVIIILCVVFALIFYVYSSICLQFIAQKAQKEPAWLAWVPVGNLFLMCSIGGVSYWWLFILLAAFIPIAGPICVIAFSVYVWYKIAAALNKPGWLGILTIVPLAGLVVMGYLAFSKE